MLLVNVNKSWLVSRVINYAMTGVEIRNQVTEITPLLNNLNTNSNWN